MTVLVGRPVSAIVIRVEPYLATFGTAGPFLHVTILPCAIEWLKAYRLRIASVTVMQGIVLDIRMDAILFIAKDIVTIGNTFQQVNRLVAVIPRLLRELDTTGRSKSRYLVLHVGNTMVDKHRTHGEARPVDTVFVNVKTRIHLVNGLAYEVLVLGTASVPSVTVTTQVGDDKFRRINHLVYLVRAILVLWVLVHAVCDNHQW